MKIATVSAVIPIVSALLIVWLAVIAVRAMVNHVRTIDHDVRERLIEAEMKNIEKCRKLRGTLTYDRRMTFTGCNVPPASEE